MWSRLACKCKLKQHQYGKGGGLLYVIFDILSELIVNKTVLVLYVFLQVNVLVRCYIFISLCQLATIIANLCYTQLTIHYKPGQKKLRQLEQFIHWQAELLRICQVEDLPWCKAESICLLRSGYPSSSWTSFSVDIHHSAAAKLNISSQLCTFF